MRGHIIRDGACVTALCDVVLDTSHSAASAPVLHMIESMMSWLLAALALPAVGLGSVFVVSFVSATLLPLGSEPAVFAVIKANPALYWSVILIATAGNTLGGAVDYWMGWQARQVVAQQNSSHWSRAMARFGPKILLLGWLPIVGDPLCTLAGWSRLPLWPCVMYMAVGKAARYIAITAALQLVTNLWWQQLIRWF
jgi:membrane protein YqaA with SNARE-associated domain